MRSGDFCGGAYVDREFINFLKIIVGESAVDLLMDKHYGQYQFLIHEFCKNVKLLFTGIEEEYKVYEMDLEV